MKRIKLTVSALIAALALSTAAPTPKAEAGIILAPAGVGVIIFLIGVWRHNPWLIVLDADGNLSQSSLEANFARTYPFIDNKDVIHNLASLIREKGGKIPTDGKDEPQKKITADDSKEPVCGKDDKKCEEPQKKITADDSKEPVCGKDDKKCEEPQKKITADDSKEPVCGKDDKKCEEPKKISLSQEEVLDILAPTGLADLQPEAVQALIKDLE